MVVRHGYAPVSHGTFRIGLADLAKRLLCRRIGERVEERNSLVEGALRLGRTGYGKRHFTKFLRRGVLMMLLTWRRGPKYGERRA